MAKQAPTITVLPQQLDGESDRDYERRIMAFLNGEDVRTVTDLRDFKTCDFHLAPEKV